MHRPTMAGKPAFTRRAAVAAGAGILALALALPLQTTAAEPLDLVPHEDPAFGLVSVVPAGWQGVGSGAFLRADGPGDTTLIALQSAPVAIDALWPSLLPQLGIDEVPEPEAQRDTAWFTWDLYRVEAPVAAGAFTADLALAEADGATRLVLMQSATDERDALYETVFLPAVDAFAPLEAVATASADAAGPVGGTEAVATGVAFTGGAADVELAGTLTLPAGRGPHPAIVLLSGSGPSDRDESLEPVAAIKPFALIAEALTDAGIAVLRYDDRGVGASTGDYETATIADFTADAGAALSYLELVDGIDRKRLGVLGHSEGAVYAAALAADDPRVSFAVAMAPPVVDGIALLAEQNAVAARASGLDEAAVARARDDAAELYRALVAGDEGAEAIAREFFGTLWDGAPADLQARLGARDEYVEAQITAQMPVLTSDAYRALLSIRPVADWERVTIPVLALFGGKDTQVLTAQNRPVLEEALARAGNEAAEVVTLADANHLFQAAESGGLAEYGTLAQEFTADFLPVLVEWVAGQAAVGAHGQPPA